jgi:hypothetical protein
VSGNRERRAELVAPAARSRSACTRRPAVARQDADEDLAWQTLCPSGLRVISMPDCHADLISPPYVGEVVAALTRDLAGHRRDGASALDGCRP